MADRVGHTPGPWLADPGSGGCIFAPDGHPVMTAGPDALDDDGSAWANALLIAAAPELLQAARELVESIDGREGEGAVEHYDRIAMEFYAETRIWPPGKSAPMEMHTGDPEDAHKAWRAWLKERRDRTVSAARAAVAKAEGRS